MNAILDKVKELAPNHDLPNWRIAEAMEPEEPGYTIPQWQRELPGSDDPVQQIADGLSARVMAARERLAELTQVPVDETAGEDVISMMTLNRPIRPNYSSMPLSQFSLSPERWLELGRLSARETTTTQPERKTDMKGKRT